MFKKVDFAQVVDDYLNCIKTELGKYDGRLFWTGHGSSFINIPLGKNSVSNVPHEG